MSLNYKKKTEAFLAAVLNKPGGQGQKEIGLAMTQARDSGGLLQDGSDGSGKNWSESEHILKTELIWSIGGYNGYEGEKVGKDDAKVFHRMELSFNELRKTV